MLIRFLILKEIMKSHRQQTASDLELSLVAISGLGLSATVSQGPCFLLANYKDPKAVWDERLWGVDLASADHQATSHLGQLGDVPSTPKRGFVEPPSMKELAKLND